LSFGHTPPPPIEPTSVFAGLRPRSIALGLLVDLASSFAAMLILTLALVAGRDIDFGEEPSPEVLEELTASPEFLLLAFVVGTLCTALGGYVGARHAGCHHVRHGAFVGLASLLLGLLAYALMTGAPTAPLWYDLAAFLVVVPAGAAGGWLAGRGVGLG
jgi:hypothetical protein